MLREIKSPIFNTAVRCYIAR